MLLNSQVTHAITILNLLKDQVENLTIADMCKDRNLPAAFLQQIALKLKKAKIIASRKGPGGGYFLEKDTVTLLELCEVFHEPNEKWDGRQGEIGERLKYALSQILVITPNYVAPAGFIGVEVTQ